MKHGIRSYLDSKWTANFAAAQVCCAV